jgi:hypothetical protein
MLAGTFYAHRHIRWQIVAAGDVSWQVVCPRAWWLAGRTPGAWYFDSSKGFTGHFWGKIGHSVVFPLWVTPGN